MCSALWLVRKCAGGSSRKGATKTKRAYRTTPSHAHHRGNKARVKAKAQPGMAGAIPGRLGRVCLAYSAPHPRLPVEECGGRGPGGDAGQSFTGRKFQLFVQIGSNGT
jgi:hypothetical protein